MEGNPIVDADLLGARIDVDWSADRLHRCVFRRDTAVSGRRRRLSGQYFRGTERGFRFISLDAIRVSGS